MSNLETAKEHIATIRDNGFDHIASNIEAFMGNEAMLKEYLVKLVFNDRGIRKGFPKDVLLAVGKIKELLTEEDNDIWSLSVF